MYDFDADENGSINQWEARQALDAWGGGDDTLLLLTGNATPLTNREKAILWQIQNASWKPGRNPYDKEIGQEVYDLLNGDKEEKEEVMEKTPAAAETAGEDYSWQYAMIGY